jgi:uncharacterized membrane protein
MRLKKAQQRLYTILHEIFEVGIFIKFFGGVFWTIIGFLFLILSPEAINRITLFLLRRELLEDPGDILATFFINSAQNLSIGSQVFIGIYFIIHGTLNIAIFIAMWQRKIWAYPFVGIVLSILLAYELFRIWYHPSFILVFVSFVDILILGLLGFEYKNRLRYTFL